MLLFFAYSNFGFLILHPFLSMYYKSLGLSKAESPIEDEVVEFIIVNKEDIAAGKINFQWIHSREFKLNGVYYDVVKKSEDSNFFFLYCINDHAESLLEEEFQKRVHQNSKENKNLPSIIKYSPSISEAAQLIYINFAIEYQLSFDCRLNNSYKSFYLEIPSPPPRFV